MSNKTKNRANNRANFRDKYDNYTNWSVLVPSAWLITKHGNRTKRLVVQLFKDFGFKDVIFYDEYYLDSLPVQRKGKLLLRSARVNVEFLTTLLSPLHEVFDPFRLQAFHDNNPNKAFPEEWPGKWFMGVASRSLDAAYMNVLAESYKFSFMNYPDSPHFKRCVDNYVGAWGDLKPQSQYFKDVTLYLWIVLDC